MTGSVSLIGYGLAVLGAGIGIGIAGGMTTGAMARQPEVSSTLQTIFILSAAFIEALALLGFVLCLIK
jgi:F-type H+-transporting ATPase subunit c